MESIFRILSVLLALCTTSACRKACCLVEDRDVRQEMRTFVQEIAASGREKNPGFIVIANNGYELLTTTQGEADSPIARDYIEAIDGLMYESLFFSNADVAVDSSTTVDVRAFLDLAKDNAVTPLVIDFCNQPANVDYSYSRNSAAGYLSYASPNDSLGKIPSYPVPLFGENTLDIQTLSDAHNFLHLNQFEGFANKADVVYALTATNYDLIIMEPFWDRDTAFGKEEINQLKAKHNQGKRLVVAYMSIGEAEKYRYYWETRWHPGAPSFITCASPYSGDNFRVKYWDSTWKELIYGGADSYLQKIIDAGFDGVFLDVVDAYTSFEKQE